MKVWRGQPENWSWKPSRLEKARLWLGLTGLFYLLAIVALRSPASSSGTGRLGWVENALSAAFGARGDLLLYGILGTACLAASLHYFRKLK